MRLGFTYGEVFGPGVARMSEQQGGRVDHERIVAGAREERSRMSRRADPLETVRLSIELLRRIPRKRKVTAAQLCEQLAQAGISRNVRTIQRQLEVLSEHYDVERDDTSEPFGYRWKESDAGLALTTMTAQESLLLSLAQQHLQILLPARVVKSLDTFFAQARPNLAPDGNAQMEREWLDKVRVVSQTQLLLAPEIRRGVLEEVTNALHTNRWLDVVYRNAADKESTSKVMPLGVAQQGPSLYLVCRYDGFDQERTLAVHRMRSAKASTLGFERPADFSLQRFVDDGQFGLGHGQRVVVSFVARHAGRHLLETPLSADQEVEHSRRGYRIRATVTDSEVLRKWLRGFGADMSNVRVSAGASPPTLLRKATTSGRTESSEPATNPDST